jgi:hypothetical protein
LFPEGEHCLDRRSVTNNQKHFSGCPLTVESEHKIEDLLTQALTVEDPKEVERVLHELQKALEEHIWHTKVSLAAQASLIAPEAPQANPVQKAKSATP